MLKSESKLVNGDYITVRETMFHTVIEKDGEEIVLDMDFDSVLKMLGMD